MKKIFRLFAALAATTMAFSCMEEANPETGVQNGGSKFEGPMVTLTFSVDELTKTSYDKENGHQWSEGDQIKIVYGTEDDAFTVAEVVDGAVTATVGDVDTYYAVYPETTTYTLAVPEGGAEAQLSIVIPQTQDGSFKQANIMAAKTTKTDAMFEFKNLTHIFKFTLSDDTKYKGFQFMSNLSSKFMSAGLSSVTFNADSVEPVTVGVPTTGKIGEETYTASSVVQAGNLEPGGTYYIGLYPNVDMSYGFGFKATKSEGTTGWSEGALITTPVTTKRSEITSIPNVDKMIRNHWFFRADGTGNGSDWEHAGGVDLLVKLLGSELADGVEYHKNTNGWRLYGAELHLAAGTYELPKTIAFQLSVNNITKIYGGYPTTLTGTSLEDRDASANETIITKNGGSRLFYGNGSTLYNWTWDGIIFTLNEGTTTTDRGGAFYFNNSTKGTLKFNDCKFSNIETTAEEGGGAINFNTQTQTMKATFTNCDFENNTGKIGGAITIQDGRKATLTFKGCNFSKNTATTAGGAIANCVGTIIVDNCSFINNTSTNHGGAICTYGEKLSGNATITGLANTYIYNSLFDGNTVSSSNQGGTIKAHGNGNLVLVNSTLRNSSASTGIIRLRSQVTESVKAWIIGCTFSENNKNSLYNQSSRAYVYNTVMNDVTSYIANQDKIGVTSFSKSVIFNTNYYNIASGELTGKAAITTMTNVSTLDGSVVGAFSNGVYSVIGTALTSGMSSTELAALGAEGSALMTAMPLFETKYLTVDQKGNSREGKTVMGAYVGE